MVRGSNPRYYATGVHTGGFLRMGQTFEGIRRGRARSNVQRVSVHRARFDCRQKRWDDCRPPSGEG
jgi:hypothetical protein